MLLALCLRFAHRLLAGAHDALGHQAAGGDCDACRGLERLVDAVGFVLSHQGLTVLSSVDFASVRSLHAGALHRSRRRHVEAARDGRAGRAHRADTEAVKRAAKAMLDNRVELVVQIAQAHQTMLDKQEEAAAEREHAALWAAGVREAAEPRLLERLPPAVS